MVQSNLLEELTPPGEREELKNVDASIIEAVAERKISYPAEIVGDTGINRQTVFDHIRWLAKEGKLERVCMKQFVPDELKGRLQELWDCGLKGGMIKRMTWYKVAVVAEVKDVGKKDKK